MNQKELFPRDRLYRAAVTATLLWYQRKHHTKVPENFTIQQMLDAYNYWNVECLFDDVLPEHKKTRDVLGLFLTTYKLVKPKGEGAAKEKPCGPRNQTSS